MIHVESKLECNHIFWYDIALYNDNVSCESCVWISSELLNGFTAFQTLQIQCHNMPWYSALPRLAPDINVFVDVLNDQNYEKNVFRSTCRVEIRWSCSCQLLIFEEHLIVMSLQSLRHVNSLRVIIQNVTPNHAKRYGARSTENHALNANCKTMQIDRALANSVMDFYMCYVYIYIRDIYIIL